METSSVEQPELRDFVLPDWAARKGFDEFGNWVEFEVNGIAQRMRWVDSGTFLMGSKDDDKEAYSRETPRHRVTLTSGFWMFDSPCTQSLWAIVMDSMPSRFGGDLRPVEQVSWRDCQEFIVRFHELVTGL